MCECECAWWSRMRLKCRRALAFKVIYKVKLPKTETKYKKKIAKSNKVHTPPA